MALQDAIKFIKQAAADDILRNSLYKVNPNEILPELEKQGYKFTLNEFEESINVLHVECQTEEEVCFSRCLENLINRGRRR